MKPKSTGVTASCQTHCTPAVVSHFSCQVSPIDFPEDTAYIQGGKAIIPTKYKKPLKNSTRHRPLPLRLLLKSSSSRYRLPEKICHRNPVHRQIGGRFSPFVPGLLINGNLITSPEEVVEELACHYENTSSSLHYSPSFLKTKSRMEKCRLDFSTCLE